GRVGAGAGGRVARPRVVTVVGGWSVDAGPGAGARLAAVALGAGVAVVAAGPVHLGRVRADAGSRVARPRVVALVGGRALDAGPDAGATLAAVALRAGVAVVAAGAVRLGRVRADAGCRIARPRVVTLVRCTADHRVGELTDAVYARVGGAGVAVVAVRGGVARLAVGDRRVLAADERDAGVLGTSVAVVAGRRRARETALGPPA